MVKPMTLMEELLLEPGSHGPTCGVKTLLDTHPDGLEIETAINSGYPATSLSRVLARRGISLKYLTIQRHRRGDCACRSKTS